MYNVLYVCYMCDIQPFCFVFHLRFSVNVLLSLCQQAENRPLAGVVVIGNGQSAHAIALSGTSMQLPVLWAKGGTTHLKELRPEVHSTSTFLLLTLFYHTLLDKH